jgi:aerobic carbon-monoxide dehydrogenase large subunit
MTDVTQSAPYVGQSLRRREDVKFLTGTGQLLTGSLLDYTVPRADSLPGIRSQFQETPAPTNPSG